MTISVKQKRKWKCPAKKRLRGEFRVSEHAQRTLVVLKDHDLDSYGKWYGNHDHFEWLHKNVSRPWFAAQSQDFFYLFGPHFTQATVIVFDFEDDAVLFALARSGRLLSDFKQTLEREHALERMRWDINRLSAADRAIKYPGLDEHLLAIYAVPSEEGRHW